VQKTKLTQETHACARERNGRLQQPTPEWLSPFRVSRARKRGYERVVKSLGEGGERQSFKVRRDISACAHSYVLEL